MNSHDDTKPVSSESTENTEAPTKTTHSARVIKWSNRLIMAGAIIPILLFLGFAAAISLIDFNQYKPQIEQQVTERSGHELKINGSIEVSMFPFTFNIGNVALRNEPTYAKEFGQLNLMSIKQVRVEVSLWNLFIHKQLSIVGLELVEPNAVLLIDKQGNNWHRLAQRLVPGSTFAEATVQRRFANATLEDLPKLFRVAQDPSLGSAQKETVPAAEDLAGDAMTSATPPSPDLNDKVLPTTDIGSEGELFRWHFDSVVVTKGHFEVQDSVVNHQAVISNMNLMAFDVTLGKPFQIRTDFAYHNTLRERHYEFDLTTYVDINREFSRWQVSDWQGVFKLKLPEKYKVPEMRLVTEGKMFSLNLVDNQVQVTQAQLDALGSRITTSFSGHYGGEANLYGAMTVNGINVQSWGRHLGVKIPEFVNPKALTQVKGQVDWMLSEDKLDLNNVELTWDNSTLKGQLWHKLAPESEYAFDFTIDKLNLDDYRAYSSLTSKSAKDSDQKQVSNDRVEASSKPVATNVATQRETYLPIAAPISTLRALKADGKLVVGQLVTSGVKMHDLTMELHAEKGKLQLAPLDAKLYQGQLASKLVMDVNGSTPAFRWQGELQQVDVAGLSQDGWQKRPLDGRMSSVFNLGTRGSNEQALILNLNGDLNLTLNNGHFYGVDVDKLLAGQAVSENDKMPYDSIQLKGAVNQGVFKSKQMAVKTPNFKGSGSGTLDLNKSIIDTRFKVLVTKPPKSLGHLKGMTVPIRYQGPLQQAEWSVNLQSLLNDPGNQQKLVNQLKTLLQ